MRFVYRLLVVLLLMAGAMAALRDHTVVLGQWHTVKTLSDSGETGEVRVRDLFVDEQLKEYTSGAAHQVTDRLFVIRRAYRVNDTLPDDKRKQPAWVWRLGGWISVDRITGHVAQLNLPAFDADSSEAAWYRDYAAYCGEEGGKTYLVVWQLGKRRPLVRKEFPGLGCETPLWERGPSRVTFTTGGEKNTFTVHARGATSVDTDDDDEPR